MKSFLKVIFFFLCFTALNPSFAGPKAKKELHKKQKAVLFTENKGQVSDQYSRLRPDVLYSGVAGRMVFHLKKTGVSYQVNGPVPLEESNRKADFIRKKASGTSVFRLDVNWLNCNTTTDIANEVPQADYTNYYLANCAEGVLNVKSYGSVTYKNIYNGIDLKWYEQQGALKYDYLVSAGSDYKNIRLSFEGATALTIDSKGGLVIKTPFGNIVEEAPIVIQSGKRLPAKWILKNNTAEFDIQQIDPSRPFVIDPMVRYWATYYGSFSDEYAACVRTDRKDNVFMCGHTYSSNQTNLATVGAHQTTMGSFSPNAFLVKFNSAGTRLWATLYGDVGDKAYSCSPDTFGNIFVCGVAYTYSGTAIATPGSHKPAMGGNPGHHNDAFLVKFDSSGVRHWGTYFGGLGNEDAQSCTTDPAGNVFISGITNSTIGIATLGSFQPTVNNFSDFYLAAFDSAGVQKWGTYYGDDGADQGGYCATDKNGNIFLAGTTAFNSGTTIVTPGAYQLTNGGGHDGFIVKFDPLGNRIWGTYCGGSGTQEVAGCAVDTSGNIFISGSTTSATAFVTTGAHQSTYSGGTNDAFLAKFSAAGVKQWATYYGADKVDKGAGCATDRAGNAYMTGYTGSGALNPANFIASSDGYQPYHYGGPADAFFVKFNPQGQRIWGTFYGTGSTDLGYSCAADRNGRAYVCGTSSVSGLASAGSFQQFPLGALDAFLAVFYECAVPSPTNTTPPLQLGVCYGNSTTLTASGTGTITWFGSAVPNLTLATGNTFVIPSVTSTQTYYAENTTCAPSGTRIAIMVTAYQTPLIVINGVFNPVCAGTQVQISVTGGVSYTWSPSIYTGTSFWVTPTSNMTFSVWAKDVHGCKGDRWALLKVNPLPNVTIAGSTLICEGEETTLTANGAVNYNWEIGDITKTITLTPLATSTIAVTGTDANNCSKTASVVVVVDPCAGIKEGLSSGAVLIYPNPANKTVNVEVKGTKTTVVQLYNSLGQLVRTSGTRNGTVIIDVESIPRGVYTLKILSEGKPSVLEKIIIE